MGIPNPNRCYKIRILLILQCHNFALTYKRCTANLLHHDSYRSRGAVIEASNLTCTLIVSSTLLRMRRGNTIRKVQLHFRSNKLSHSSYNILRIVGMPPSSSKWPIITKHFISIHYSRKISIMDIVSHIQNNEIISLTITDIPKAVLDKGQKIDEFIQALESNTSITTVDLKEDFLACVRADMRSQIIKAIGKLPNIQQVYLADSLVLVPDLTELLTNAKSLTVLNLKAVCLQGPPEYFDDFEKALQTHPALKTFDMIECMTANQSIDMGKLQNAADAGKKPASVNVGSESPLVVNPAASA
jgi:hypothetical protein